MKKHFLKVEPAKKIYKPKYPSYSDKNPLLYPETRPYPFNQRFLNWAMTGGLAGAMLFGGGDLMAQTGGDTLYNPFPVMKTKVPFRGVSFGTGLPERVSSQEAIKAIRNAFKAMNIALESEVWVRDDVGVYLDGYNAEEKIGFLLFDGRKMDGSFLTGFPKSPNKKEKPKSAKKKKTELERKMDSTISNRKHDFEKFIENKAWYISRRDYKSKAELLYFDKLIPLDPRPENEEKFNELYMEFWLGLTLNQYENSDELLGEIVRHINERFTDPLIKKALFASNRKFSKNNFGNEKYYCAITNEFAKLKDVKSDKEFVEKLFILEKFNHFHHSYALKKDADYLDVKIKIMETNPIKKWFDNLDQLSACAKRKQISFEEAQNIDKNTQARIEFIAPIMMGDDLMLVNNSYRGKVPFELANERDRLYREYEEENGITKEIRKEKEDEIRAIYKKYYTKEIKELPRPERDSFKVLKREATARMQQKYKDMEKLTDKEKAVYRKKMDAVRVEIDAWQKEDAELIRMKTLKKLEEEVKVYINWARSQMGG